MVRAWAFFDGLGVWGVGYVQFGIVVDFGLGFP